MSIQSIGKIWDIREKGKGHVKGCLEMWQNILNTIETRGNRANVLGQGVHRMVCRMRVKLVKPANQSYEVKWKGKEGARTVFNLP